MLKAYNKTPFPYWGGKSDAAEAVWEALGDVVHYVEPFAGSLAVLLRRPHPANRPYHSETVNDLDGLLCLAPETLVLMGDMRWTPIGMVSPGDTLIGFDEENTGECTMGGSNHLRRWQRTKAVSTHRVIKNSYRLTFSDGTSVVASEDHQWLCSNGHRWKWVKTSGMVCNRKTQRSHVLKLCDVTHREDSYEAGWLGGFLDGEGHLRKNPGWYVSASQKVGPEADRFCRMMAERGFSISRVFDPRKENNPKHKNVETFNVNGGMRETLRLLMMLRPERLIQTALDNLPSHTLYGRSRQSVSLVSKEYLGPTEVVALETESHTYVAEGLASHNCNAWRGIAYAPDEVAHHASWPVSEADLMARHLALVAWKNEKNVGRLMADPDFYDAKMAGWWVWGSSSWIGSGWCTGTGSWTVGADGRITKVPRTHNGVSRQVPHMSKDGQGVNVPGIREAGVSRQLPRVSEDGVGINAHRSREYGVSRQIPHISDSGLGINRPQAREEGVETDGDFHPMTMPETLNWMRFLSARLRHVRIINGSWERVCTSGVLKTLSVRQKTGVAGVFLDPPYDNDVRTEGLYAHDSGHVATDAREWCKANGDDPMYRIVLAGYDTEHSVLETLGWRVVEWYKPGFLKGGMGNQSDKGTSQRRERLWLSPHCLNPSDTPKITSMDDLFGF